ncbi:MAG: hypothetical protein DME75_09475 [Verrucomicrobia bacterium]|nr:MAG: hypothetical protein DME75_09475 [Verrucomicrobiota bacterium]
MAAELGVFTIILLDYLKNTRVFCEIPLSTKQEERGSRCFFRESIPLGGRGGGATLSILISRGANYGAYSFQ